MFNLQNSSAYVTGCSVFQRLVLGLLACEGLRERLSYYDLDEDAFHDTYLLVLEKALCSVGGIADFEAYFRACYRHAVLHRHRTPRRDVHPGTGFFLRLCDEGPTVPEEELGACERLVLDILAFIRRSFPHEVCRLFLLRHESPGPAVTARWRPHAGTTPSRAAREVKASRAGRARKPTFRTAKQARRGRRISRRRINPEKAKKAVKENLAGQAERFPGQPKQSLLALSDFSWYTNTWSPFRRGRRLRGKRSCLSA